MIKDTAIFSSIPYKKSIEFVKSPMRYPGGKFYALPHIMPFIECIPHDEYREPFFGGGAVFFAKKKTAISIINDLDSDIIQFYQFIQNSENAAKLIELFSHEEASRSRHTEVKEFVPSNELESAFKTYYLNRTSYSGIIKSPAWGYVDGKSSPPQNWGKFIQSASKKLQGVEIYNKDYSEIIKMRSNGSSVLMYLDPPYYHADTKRAYTKPFRIEDHNRLADDLRETSYYFCLSYDDCEEVRDLYNWAYIYEKAWNYNTANRHGTRRSTGRELIITNYVVQ